MYVGYFHLLICNSILKGSGLNEYLFVCLRSVGWYLGKDSAIVFCSMQLHLGLLSSFQLVVGFPRNVWEGLSHLSRHFSAPTKCLLSPCVDSEGDLMHVDPRLIGFLTKWLVYKREPSKSCKSRWCWFLKALPSVGKYHFCHTLLVLNGHMIHRFIERGKRGKSVAENF